MRKFTLILCIAALLGGLVGAIKFQMDNRREVRVQDCMVLTGQSRKYCTAKERSPDMGFYKN